MAIKLTDKEKDVLNFRLWFDGCMAKDADDLRFTDVQSIGNHFFVVDNVFDPECHPDIVKFMEKAIKSESTKKG